jgi:hypothetical protein
LALCRRTGAMEAQNDRRDRRARRGLGHEVGAVGVACGDDLLLESRGVSLADGVLSVRSVRTRYLEAARRSMTSNAFSHWPFHADSHTMSAVISMSCVIGRAMS